MKRNKKMHKRDASSKKKKIAINKRIKVKIKIDIKNEK